MTVKFDIFEALDIVTDELGGDYFISVKSLSMGIYKIRIGDNIKAEYNIVVDIKKVKSGGIEYFNNLFLEAILNIKAKNNQVKLIPQNYTPSSKLREVYGAGKGFYGDKEGVYHTDEEISNKLEEGD